MKRHLQNSALSLGGLLMVTGLVHFAAPENLDRMIPHGLSVPRRTWTYASGAIEIGLAIGILRRGTRRLAATLTAVFLVLVFPANIQMAADSASGSASGYALALFRLPLQLPLIWWAWRVRNQRHR